jgi:hypothetical protein
MPEITLDINLIDAVTLLGLLFVTLRQRVTSISPEDIARAACVAFISSRKVLKDRKIEKEELEVLLDEVVAALADDA